MNRDLVNWIQYAQDEGAFNKIKNQKFLFKSYILKNPRIWDLFQDEALEAIDRKEKYLSATYVVSKVREKLRVLPGDDGLKVNDHSRIYMAKLFVFMYPEYKYIFKFKN